MKTTVTLAKDLADMIEADQLQYEADNKEAHHAVHTLLLLFWQTQRPSDRTAWVYRLVPAMAYHFPQGCSVSYAPIEHELWAAFCEAATKEHDRLGSYIQTQYPEKLRWLHNHVLLTGPTSTATPTPTATITVTPTAPTAALRSCTFTMAGLPANIVAELEYSPRRVAAALGDYARFSVKGSSIHATEILVAKPLLHGETVRLDTPVLIEASFEGRPGRKKNEKNDNEYRLHLKIRPVPSMPAFPQGRLGLEIYESPKAKQQYKRQLTFTVIMANTVVLSHTVEGHRPQANLPVAKLIQKTWEVYFQMMISERELARIISEAEAQSFACKLDVDRYTNRAFYHAARAAGWVKLRKSELTRLGIEGTWQHRDRIDALNRKLVQASHAAKHAAGLK